MNADWACRCEGDAAPGAYSTSTTTIDLPAIFGIAWSNLGVTVSAWLSCAMAGPAGGEARQMHRLGRMALLFTNFSPFNVGEVLRVCLNHKKAPNTRKNRVLQDPAETTEVACGSLGEGFFVGPDPQWSGQGD